MSQAQAAEFERRVRAALDQIPDPIVRRTGKDGISLRATVHLGATRVRGFEVWSPDAEDPCHAYFVALFDAARLALAAPRARVRLDRLHEYLGLGLPLEDHPGPPRWFRLFGSTNGTHVDPLRAAFGRVQPDEPLLIDARGLSIASVLHPVFREVGRRAGPTAWYGSEYSRRALRKAGIPADQIHPNRAAALAALAR